MKLTIPGIQSKLIGHANKQENTNHNEDNDQSIETDPELTTDVKISKEVHPKTFITTVLNMFKELITDIENVK